MAKAYHDKNTLTRRARARLPRATPGRFAVRPGGPPARIRLGVDFSGAPHLRGPRAAAQAAMRQNEPAKPWTSVIRLGLIRWAGPRSPQRRPAKKPRSGPPAGALSCGHRAWGFRSPASRCLLLHGGAFGSPPPASEASGGQGFGVGGTFRSGCLGPPPGSVLRTAPPSPPLRGGREKERPRSLSRSEVTVIGIPDA